MNSIYHNLSFDLFSKFDLLITTETLYILGVITDRFQLAVQTYNASVAGTVNPAYSTCTNDRPPTAEIKVTT